VKKIFILLLTFIFLFTNLVSPLLLKYKQKESFLIISFYDNKSCNLNIKEINLSLNYSKCFDVLFLDILDLKADKNKIELLFKLGNKTLKKTIEINKTNIFNYSLSPKKLKISDKVIININTNSKGTIKILNNYFLIKEGENKIDITNLLIKKKFLGKLELQIELCKQKYCKNFKDYIIIERSPIFCKIRIIKNLFPKYLTFDFEVFDQEKEKYYPEIIFFDMELLPFKEKDYYKIIFPKFYNTKEFLIKIKVDGKTCKKSIKLDYSNYFYAISDPLEKKLNLTKVFIQNPYNSEEKIILYSKSSNKSYLINLKPLETKVIKEKFGKFEIIYENKTVYSFEPMVIESLYSNFSNYLKSIILALFFFIIVLNIVIFLLSSK